MKHLSIIFLILISFIIGCTKTDPVEDINRTVKASVRMRAKTSGGPDYFEPGFILNKGINASGTAVVSFRYFSGVSFLTETRTLNFTVTESSNGYFEFTNIATDFSNPPTNVKMESFVLTSGNYNVTIIP